MAVEWWALQQILKNDRGGDLGGYTPPPINWKRVIKIVLWALMMIAVPVTIGISLSLSTTTSRLVFSGIVIVWQAIMAIPLSRWVAQGWH